MATGISSLSSRTRGGCSLSAAALIVALVAAPAMSQGTTGSGSANAGGAGSAGVASGTRTSPAAGTPAAASGTRLVAPATPSAATPDAGNAASAPQGSLPGSNPLPPLNANGLPPANATGVDGVNSATNAGLPAPDAIPSRTTSAAQAFGMLDRSRLGYVTRADTDRVTGFVGFDNADSNRDGQLTPAEFATAWRFYSGR